MDYGHIFWFAVFPYLSLTTFILGHLYRYFTNPLDWNPKSSEILSREGLKYGVFFFMPESFWHLSAMPAAF